MLGRTFWHPQAFTQGKAFWPLPGGVAEGWVGRMARTLTLAGAFATTVGLTGAVGMPVALAQSLDGGLVGRLSWLTEPSMADELRLTDDQRRKLADLQNQREDGAIQLAQPRPGVDEASRRAKLVEWADQSEKLGLDLLSPTQRQAYRELAMQRRGFESLADPVVSEPLRLSDEQQSQIAAVLAERADALEKATTARKPFVRDEYDRKLASVLEDHQRVAWRMTAGLPAAVPGGDASAETDSPSPGTPSSATPSETMLAGGPQATSPEAGATENADQASDTEMSGTPTPTPETRPSDASEPSAATTEETETPPASTAAMTEADAPSGSAAPAGSDPSEADAPSAPVPATPSASYSNTADQPAPSDAAPGVGNGPAAIPVPGPGGLPIPSRPSERPSFGSFPTPGRPTPSSRPGAPTRTDSPRPAAPVPMDSSAMPERPSTTTVVGGGSAGETGPLTGPRAAADFRASNAVADGSEDNMIRFTFANTPWPETLKIFAEEAGLSLIMRTPPAGAFNFTSERRYTPGQAIDLLNSVLQYTPPGGFTLVRHDKLLFLIDLREQVPTTLVELVPATRLDERGNFDIVKTLFAVTKLSVDEAAAEINAMAGPATNVTPLPRSRQILVVDTAGRLRQYRDLIREIEQPGGLTSDVMKVIALDHASAETVLQVAANLLGLDSATFAKADGTLRLTADTTGTKIYVTGAPNIVEQFDRIKDLVDTPENAAAQLAPNVPSLRSYSIGGKDPEQVRNIVWALIAPAGAEAEDTGVRISTDETTGTLLVYGPPEVQQRVTETIELLSRDQRELAVLTLTKLNPTDVAPQILRFMGVTDPTAPPPGAPTLTAEIGGQQLFVRGTSSQVEEIKRILGQLGESLDGSVALGGGGNIRQITTTGGSDVVRQLEALWPAVGRNPIRVVRLNDPAGANGGGSSSGILRTKQIDGRGQTDTPRDQATRMWQQNFPGLPVPDDVEDLMADFLPLGANEAANGQTDSSDGEPSPQRPVTPVPPEMRPLPMPAPGTPAAPGGARPPQIPAAPPAPQPAGEAGVGGPGDPLAALRAELQQRGLLAPEVGPAAPSLSADPALLRTTRYGAGQAPATRAYGRPATGGAVSGYFTPGATPAGAKPAAASAAPATSRDAAPNRDDRPRDDRSRDDAGRGGNWGDRGRDERSRNSDDRPSGDPNWRRDRESRTNTDSPFRFVAFQAPEGGMTDSAPADGAMTPPAAPGGQSGGGVAGAEGPRPLPPGVVNEPGAPITITVGPGGIMIASKDLAALDQLEDLLNRMITSESDLIYDYTLIYLKHTTANYAKSMLDKILAGDASAGESSGGGDPLGGLMGMGMDMMGMGSMFGGFGSTSSTTGPVTIIPDTRLNALYIQGYPEDVNYVEQLLRVIDQERSPEDIQTEGVARVIPVVNITPTRVVELVKEVYSARMEQTQRGGGQGGGGQGGGPDPAQIIQALRGARGGGEGGRGGGGGGGGQNAAPVQEVKMTIGADEASRTVIVRAPEPLLSEVTGLIKQMDEAAVALQTATVVLPIKATNPQVIASTLKSLMADESTSINITSSGGTSTQSSTTRGGATSGGTRGSTSTPTGGFGGFGGFPGGFGGGTFGAPRGGTSTRGGGGGGAPRGGR